MSADLVSAKDAKSAFIVHWIEPWTWLLRWFRHLNSNPYLAIFWTWTWPLCFLMTYLYKVGNKAYDIVDRFVFSGMPGETVVVRNFAHHFSGENRTIIPRILEAVLAAQDRGATVIGLGALIKGETVTQGGALILDKLGDKLKVPVVHGDTMTAAVVLQQCLQIVRAMKLEKPVFIIGATSKIGRALALALVKRGVRVRMLSGAHQRFVAIQNEAGPNGHLLEYASQVREGADCPFWVTGKAQPSGEEIIKHLPKDGTVINFSVPDPLTSALLVKRRDVRHFDGGLMAYDPKTTSMWFRMRLVPGLTYACHAGTITHSFMGWKHHEVGPVEVELLDAVLEAGKRAGFSLPPWTSFLRLALLFPAQEAA